MARPGRSAAVVAVKDRLRDRVPRLGRRAAAPVARAGCPAVAAVATDLLLARAPRLDRWAAVQVAEWDIEIASYLEILCCHCAAGYLRTNFQPRMSER